LENNMDMRQLIAQIDHIENKQILNENAHYTTAPVDNSPRVSKSNNQTSIYEMLIKEFGYDLNEAPAVPNPYQGADAAKFAAMSPADQAWLTKGGGKPDINDEFILARAPNKGAAVTPAAAPGGAAQPASALPAGMTQADVDAAQNRSEPEPAAASALPAGMTQAQVDQAQNREEPSALPAGMTQAQVDQAQNRTEPGATPSGAAQPAKPAAGASNKSMTPAINAYASRMGLLKNNKPDVAAIKKFQKDNGLKDDGVIGPNTAGAILSAQKPGAGGRGGPTAAQAAPAAPAGGAAQPAPTGKPPRYKTPQEFDQEIARFSKTSNPNLPPNARYIATLKAEKAALGSGGGAQPAAPVDPTKLSVSQRIATQPSVIDQARAKLGIPAGGTSPTKEDSVRAQDDAILERIRTALFR
jgi:hypothetical protein